MRLTTRQITHHIKMILDKFEGNDISYEGIAKNIINDLVMLVMSVTNWFNDMDDRTYRKTALAINNYANGLPSTIPAQINHIMLGIIIHDVLWCSPHDETTITRIIQDDCQLGEFDETITNRLLETLVPLCTQAWEMSADA